MVVSIFWHWRCKVKFGTSSGKTEPLYPLSFCWKKLHPYSQKKLGIFLTFGLVQRHLFWMDLFFGKKMHQVQSSNIWLFTKGCFLAPVFFPNTFFFLGNLSINEYLPPSLRVTGFAASGVCGKKGRLLVFGSCWYFSKNPAKKEGLKWLGIC